MGAAVPDCCRDWWAAGGEDHPRDRYGTWSVWALVLEAVSMSPGDPWKPKEWKFMTFLPISGDFG